MADVRSEIGKALEGKFTPEQTELLLNEVLAITKQVWVSCPACKKKSLVEVPDAKAVVGALTDLSNQAWGRPNDTVQDEQVAFTREVRFDPRYLPVG